MKSMTGFGASQKASALGDFSVQLKAVNARYLDVKFSLPKEYGELESELKALLKAKVSRGHIEVYAHRRLKSGKKKVHVSADEDLARAFLQKFRALEKRLGLKPSSDVSLSDLARLSPIFDTKEDRSVSKEEKVAFKLVFNKALENLVKEKAREGAALKKTFTSLLSSLKKQLMLIEKERKQVITQIEKKWKSKIARLVDEGMEPNRLAQEATLIIDKSDINEEIVRLREHIKNCQKIIKEKGRIGKKFEFYTQELLREVNTVGSKSQNVLLTSAVVDAKNIIEQIREQVQNIE